MREPEYLINDLESYRVERKKNRILRKSGN